MHTIDLLNGSHIPRGSTLGGLGLAVSVLLVPCLLAAGASYRYWHNRTTLAILEKAIATAQAKSVDVSPAAANAALVQDRNRLTQRLAEVASQVQHCKQWSPILVALAENMPDSMVLTELAAERTDARRAVTSDADPKKTQVVTIPSRTLVLTVAGRPDRNYDTAVRDFTNHLRQSAVLGPKLEEIVVSQQAGRLDEAATVLYHIECIFKTSL